MSDVTNNGVTDLTQDGGAGAGSAERKKKQRPPKEPAAAAPETGRGAKSGAKAGGKKGKRLRLKIILILILVILIGTFVFLEINFELVGIRRMIVNAALSLDPESAILEERTAELEQFETELNRREDELDQRESSADSREAQLDRRRAQLDALEDELREKELRLIPIYRQPMTDEELADMLSLSRTYSMMSPETSAEILSELYDLEDITAILYFMTERNAAAILSEMEVDLAARITLVLLYYH